MCGVFGFVTSNPKKELAVVFRSLLLNSSLRGRDATGIAFVDKAGDITMHKTPCDAPTYDKNHLGNYIEGIGKSMVAIGHVRATTQGTEKDNNNNHPVESEHYYMIHNGTLHTLPRLDKYKYKGEVDTEILLSYIEEKGIQEAVPYLGYGSGAIAILRKDDPFKLVLTRYTSPIYMALYGDNETILFASDDDIIFKSVPLLFNLFPVCTVIRMKEEIAYSITAKPLSVKELFTYKVKTKTYTYGTGRYWNGKEWESIEEWRERWGGKNRSDTIGNTKETTVLTTTSSDTPADTQADSDTYGYYYSPEFEAWLDPQEFPDTTKVNKYYFDNPSKDFTSWIKLLTGKGWISTDFQLCKKWSEKNKKHFIMRLDDALRENEMGVISEYSYRKRTALGIRTYLDEKDNIIAITLIPENDRSTNPIFDQYDYMDLDDVEIIFLLKHAERTATKTDRMMRFDIVDINEVEHRVLEAVYEQSVKADKKDGTNATKDETKNLPTVADDRDRSYYCEAYDPIPGVCSIKKSCLMCSYQTSCVSGM